MSALVQSPFFGISLSIFAFWIGTKIQKKTGLVICNALLIAAAMVIVVLKVFGISYDDFYQGGVIINMMLGPATTCMAMNIYAKWDLLKKNWIPVLAGCLAAVVASIGSILLMCRLFGLDQATTVSLLPKSVTTPIATAISQSYGGMVPITVAAVVVTGMMGNLTAPLLRKVFRVKDPLAAGLAIGACSHAVGTAKALELGETEGAMSGLAIGVWGLLTAIVALTFGFFL